jgi:hypothetical protein
MDRYLLCNYADYYGPAAKPILYQAVVYTEVPIVCIYGIIWLLMLKAMIMRVESRTFSFEFCQLLIHSHEHVQHAHIEVTERHNGIYHCRFCLERRESIFYTLVGTKPH